MVDSPDDNSTGARGALTAAWIGACIGALVGLWRGQALLELGCRGAEGLTLELRQWRLGLAIGAEYGWPMAWGALAGLLVWPLLRGRRAHWWLALPLAFCATWSGVVGLPFAPREQRFDQLPSGTLLTLEGLAATALVAAIALVAAVRSAQAGPRWSARAWTAAAVLGAALLALVPIGSRLYHARQLPWMEVQQVRREVAFAPETWTVLDQHPAQAPAPGILTPKVDYRVDGGDLPALIMPPPATVEFRVEPEDGPVRLDFAAGVDQSVPVALAKRSIKVGFEVRVNDKRVFMSLQEVHGAKSGQEFDPHWRRASRNAPELELKPGDVVTLRTAVLGFKDEDVRKGAPLRVGFGGVTLRSTTQVQRRESSPDKPNIVLVVQDTMRADHSSTYEYGKATTPALDALSARGVTYEEARSASSWTWPSTASILTGLLPDEHGVTDDSACYLLGENETLAEALQARGYTTGAFTCNPLVSKQKNFHQGFETFVNGGAQFLKSQKLVAEVRDWIDLHAGLRFFLYLHLVDPHSPYFPEEDAMAAVGEPAPEGFPGQQVHAGYVKAAYWAQQQGLGEQEFEKLVPLPNVRHLESLYDASILTGDEFIGFVVSELERHDLLDETVIVFTSDHGEEWLDHGYLAHGQSVHHELVHVPLVMAGPGLPQGVRVATPVSNRHVAPTLARLGGAELTRGVDFLDLAHPDTLPERPVFSATTHGHWNGRVGRQPIYAVREGRWVLHLAPEGSDFGVPAKDAPPGGQSRLYDVESDPEERVDVAAQHPEIAARLEATIRESLAEQRTRRRDGLHIGGGAATMELLDGIGYLDDE
ncbi:MAG: sulfatase [Planctomycetes bacterium]|nr:sulfatase [Planctomycetota bacterium]